MATYDYLKPGEALARAHESARDFEKIIGLRGIEADRLRPALTRTAAGYLRKPGDPWRAYGDRDKFREITGVVLSKNDGSGEDTEDGMITVTFADGESVYVGAKDLLCVERPI